MSDRPPDALAPLTRRLAELLASDEGTLVLAQLQRIGLLRAEPPAAAGGRPRERVGVWDPVAAGDGHREFARSAACRGEWRFWADVERIPAKRGPRVVLLGESVARGYLYDPALTPAAVLQAALGGVEVVDLARSDLVAEELALLVDQLPALGADAVVLFAGNNSHNVRYSLADLGRLGAALRRDGYAGCRQAVLDEIIVPQFRALLDRLAARAPGLPVVVVVPEFNLGDWRCEPALLAPVLRAGANVPWMLARAEAERALAAGDPARAAARAREMLALDGGTGALAHELLARASLALGRPADARACFEAARDAVCGLLVAHSPRCPAALQDALRARAAAHGFAVVDLPRVFERELDGALPDRRLFLDYCHLTVRGMTVAMDAVAARLAPGLFPGGRPRPLPPPPLAPDDEATAHVLAAIHNAHHGQPREILDHHLARAVATSPRALAELGWYLDVDAAVAEPWMSAAFDRLSASPLVRRYLAAGDPRVIDRLADVELTAAMARALAAAGLAPERRRAAGPRLDLLAARHHARTFRDRNAYSLAPGRAYYRALDLVSSFVFPRPADGPLAARLTCRLPGADDGGEAEVGVSLNGRSVGRLAVGRTWRTFALGLPAEALRDGVNELCLTWPLLAPRSAELLERGARRLERGVYPDVLPAWGEIHALTLDAGGAASPPPRST